MSTNQVNGAGMPKDTARIGKKLNDADKLSLEKSRNNNEIQKELKAKTVNTADTTIQERNDKKVENMSFEELKQLDENLKKDKKSDAAKDSSAVSYPQQIKDLETRKSELQKELKEKGSEMSSEDYITRELEMDMIDREIVSIKLKQKKEAE